MVKVLGLRIVAVVPVLLVLAGVVFLLQQVSPVDPARAVVGEKASREVVERAREEMGLNDPAPVQYVRYLGNVVQGDLGDSAVTRRPVSTDLGTYVPATVELIVVAFTMALLLGTLLGVVTAQGWRGAGVLRLVMIGGSSVPIFLIGLLGVILFYRNLGWLPATGRTAIRDAPDGPTGSLLLDGVLNARFDVVSDAWLHLILPATCLTLGPAVAIGRVLRSSLQHTLRSDYVRTARSKGLGERAVVLRHGLRNSIGPVLSMGGVQIAAMFSGVILIEVIFAWPGIGLYTSQAIAKGDFTTVAGVTLTLGVLYVVANLLVDLLQAAADPRIRL
jgi:peptide/nickel transport system permease protein